MKIQQGFFPGPVNKQLNYVHLASKAPGGKYPNYTCKAIALNIQLNLSRVRQES